MNFDFNKEEFVRFPKIEHFIDYCNEPDYAGITRFYVSEKIDGCNLGLSINDDGKVSVFSRSGERADCGLFKFGTDSSIIEPLISQCVRFLNHHNYQRIYLWGEYFGSNVCNRINYKVKADFRFYDGLIFDNSKSENIRLTPIQLDVIFNELGAYLKDRFLVRFTEYECTKTELYNQLVLPTHSEYCDDNAEGYVITALKDGYFSANWKLKDPKFSDRKSPKFEHSESKGLNAQFIDFITRNRAIDVLNKTTERQRIDVLVRMLLDDAKADFIKANPQILTFDEKEQKKIFNARSVPFLILKSVL